MFGMIFYAMCMYILDSYTSIEIPDYGPMVQIDQSAARASAEPSLLEGLDRNAPGAPKEGLIFFGCAKHQDSIDYQNHHFCRFRLEGPI